MLGYFSFTEVTDPAAHQAYNEWHQLDHLPEQFSLEGVRFGQRWVCTPACRAARAAVSPLLERCHYVTLYLLRGPEVVPEFMALANRLRQTDRFFAARHAHLSGPFAVANRWVSPRVKISADVVPYRPAQGIYVIVGPPVDGPALLAQSPDIAGAWAFVDADRPAPTPAPPPRHITVAFVDGDLLATAAAVGRWLNTDYPADHPADPAAPAPAPGPTAPLDWAGPLERIDASSWDWFDRLTPQ